MASKQARLNSRRGVRPSPRNEVWYRARLWNIVRTARLSVEPQLRAFVKAAIKPENQDLAQHIAVTARNMIQSNAQKYMSDPEKTGINKQSLAVASRAAVMNLDSVDKQITLQIQRALGVRVQLPKPDISHGQITQTIHLGTGDWNPDQPREPAGSSGGGQWSGGGGGAAVKASLQSRVDSATPVNRMSDVIKAREDHVYRIITGAEYSAALASGELTPGRAADTGGTVNFSKEPIPAYGGSAYGEHGVVVEVPEAKLDDPRIYWGSKDLYASTEKSVPLSDVSRAWAFQFGDPGLRVVPATDMIRGRHHTGDAAKIIQFPPMRYGSKEKTQSVVRDQIANNVQLIRSVPEEYFDRLADDIYANITSAQRWEVLADTLYDTMGYDAGITRSRANLIARDQTSKMNSAFNEDRQTSLGITQYQWQTAGDERVRPTHAANDGEIFDWDSPPEETGHPGHDVNCRCVALAQFAELEEAA